MPRCRLFLLSCVLAAVLFSVLGPAAAQTPPPITCTGGAIQPGAGGADLAVTGPCTVAAGTYQFRYVNVFNGGSLTFADARIDFWAQSILVEKDSRVIAGTPQAPIGTTGGVVTIYLYGPEPTTTSVPIACKSSATCGVDPAVWTTNPSAPVVLPGGVTDYFYAYQSLHGSMDGPDEGFFGFKVLALAYGGTINLFGKKGASYGTLDVSNSGTSWARLDNNMQAGDTVAVVDRPVDWQVGDSVVVTTTDYLPGHSEQFTVTSVGPKKVRLGISPAAQWYHRGTVEDLSVVPARVGLEFDSADLRAAVGLLTRSIRIVSAGDTFGAPFTEAPGNFFGGHTIIRQGFAQYQAQGVEFYQLGQGGSMGHYPVHFHMARATPANTFVKDSSVHDSMTRWITLHATQGVTLSRNVGYKSIGHGYYIEDGTETNNAFLTNLGVFARAAVDNAQNPRKVPGILASPDNPGVEMVPYHSDYDHPSVFWIMNGWNDFQYNFAAGAGTCGVCYWLVPAYNGGTSAGQKWTGYSAMQSNAARAAMTPLKSFIGNTCTSAMNSFNTVSNTAACLGVAGPADNLPKLQPVPNPLAPASTDPMADMYYPKVDPSGGRFPTLCDETKEDCTQVPRCASGGAAEQNCVITAIDRYTSSFHWTETNFAAIWLRPQWYLFINSVLTDVQNGGLTFVTGGGYTRSDAINGHWALARKSAFIGQSQPNRNPYAADTGPFNPDGLQCDTAAANYCVHQDEGVSVPISNFGVNQRFFSIYDGPSYQDSNAYLDIQRAPIPDCQPSSNPQICLNSEYLYGRALGMPVRPNGTCYLPNAAIAWKQPNGFYYPPAFHSQNLFFDDVDIRHFVIEPLFLPDTFTTDPIAAQRAYCTWNPGMFTGFTDIDRQTELNDDDGSLTGFADTVSVNEDPFFDAPVQTVECDSDSTAVTSPYDYVTSVVYPGCAVDNSCNQATEWSTPCSNQFCFGVPLYRQQLTGSEMKQSVSRSIKMMGQNISQRSTLTANNGAYYIDTTVGLAKQQAAVGAGGSVSVFQAGKTYYVFLLFAKPTSRQTYQLYVGKDPSFSPASSVSMVRASVDALPLTFAPGAWPAAWQRSYDPVSGLLTVSLDMSIPDFASAYAAAGAGRCRPFSFCGWNTADGKCECALQPSDPLYAECTEKNAAGDDAICSWAVKDFDCPSGGCFGFAVTLPASFATDPAVNPRPAEACFPNNTTWNVDFVPVSNDLAGDCVNAPVKNKDFCPAPRPRPR